MKNGFKVMDSDMHIIEPPDLWQRYIDPAFKDRAPRGNTDRVADLSMVGPDGSPWGRSPKNTPGQGQMRRGQNFERNQERFKPYEEMSWTGEAQLGRMPKASTSRSSIPPGASLPSPCPTWTRSSPPRSPGPITTGSTTSAPPTARACLGRV